VGKLELVQKVITSRSKGRNRTDGAEEANGRVDSVVGEKNENSKRTIMIIT